jgi:ArsR family metal-binding transcriptional regulator
MEKEEKIEIRMSITGELARKLRKIKDYYQFESYTDTIRYLITAKYEDIISRRET